VDRVLEIARKHKLRVLEDCAQSVGASYKGKPLGSMGDIGIYSLQVNKTISAGEGGAVVTSDPALFERAARFHDLGGLRAPHEQAIGKAQLDWFIGTNFRMNEFTGGVLLAQTRKLDRIVGAVRANAAQVYEALHDLPGIRFRRRFDAAGEIGSGVFIDFGTKARRDRFVAAMKAENVPAAGPGGSVVLPLQPHIIAKRTIHPAWPSFTSERGRAIRYGAETCPRTTDILGRFGGVLIDPKFTSAEIADIAAAMRKVYPEMMKA
jgi:dTDP-4-amino-4,6-dideoxygalactose transaminase